jgi:folate-binding protein YgfZ
MQEVATSPFAIPGVSDGGAHTKFSTMGAYPTEFLTDLVREHGMMDLEEAHWRLSAFPAAAAGLRDRGSIRQGQPADVVVYDYDALRIGLGAPDGSRDLEVERSPLLENGFDELHGIDWDKGCFMGQELTARTKYRALIKKRLLPVAIEGPAPEPGTQITAEGKDAGVLRSSVDGVGLALLRLDRLDAPLVAGEARLIPKKPDWVVI